MCEGIIHTSNRILSADHNPIKGFNHIVTASRYGGFCIWDTMTQNCEYSKSTDYSLFDEFLMFEARDCMSARYTSYGESVLLENFGGLQVWNYKNDEIRDLQLWPRGEIVYRKIKPEEYSYKNVKYLVLKEGEVIVLNSSFKPIADKIGGSWLISNSEKYKHISITSAIFSHDGSMMLIGQEDGVIELWDANLKVHYASEVAALFSITTVAFNNMDNCIVTASCDCTMIEIWDIEDKQLNKREEGLRGHTDTVRTVMFSPDDNFILSASDDGTCKIWDAHTHECLCTVENIPGLFVQGIDFSNLAETNFDAEDRKKLRMYGATINDITDHPDSHFTTK